MQKILTDKEWRTIPLDKSYYMRLGLKALVSNKETEVARLIESESKPVCDDLINLAGSLRDYRTKSEIYVGESGTLLRFLQFFSWKNQDSKTFTTDGTLKNRPITNNPDIVHLNQHELLKLDHNTSQWASASALCGNAERISNPPYKLALTYEVIDSWNKSLPDLYDRHLDQTIIAQAEAFKQILSGQRPSFNPEQAEDFPFAVAFGYITVQEGVKKWSSLEGHESNRPLEIVNALEQAKTGNEVTSKDHRIVQAIAMWAAANRLNVTFRFPDAVKKSWPMFWEFMDLTQN
jgi:hypothetical protein